MILIIDDDFLFAATVAKNCERVGAKEVKVLGDAIAAMQFLADSGQVPSLIFLSVLLVGPDAFTFLNELRSYNDTANVPVVLLHNLRFLEKFRAQDLADYGVVAILAKSQLWPQDVQKLAQRFAARQNLPALRPAEEYA